MTTTSGANRCPECGAALAASAICAACATEAVPAETPPVRLQVLPPPDEVVPGRPPVDLIRKLKLPDQVVVADPVRLASALPDAMRTVEAALEDEDLAAADRLMDAALASVLAGPGHEKRTAARQRDTLSVVLWAWFALLGLLVLCGWFFGWFARS